MIYARGIHATNENKTYIELKINKKGWPVIEEEYYLMRRIYANYKCTI